MPDVVTPLVAVKVFEGEIPANSLETPEWEELWSVAKLYGWEVERLETTPLGRSTSAKNPWIYEMKVILKGKHSLDEKPAQHPTTQDLAKKLKELGWDVWVQKLKVRV